MKALGCCADEPSTPLHAASMHRTLVSFTEAEPALLLPFYNNLAWRRTAAHTYSSAECTAAHSAQQHSSPFRVLLCNDPRQGASLGDIKSKQWCSQSDISPKRIQPINVFGSKHVLLAISIHKERRHASDLLWKIESKPVICPCVHPRMDTPDRSQPKKCPKETDPLLHNLDRNYYGTLNQRTPPP